jgi:hypothetical protein
MLLLLYFNLYKGCIKIQNCEHFQQDTTRLYQVKFYTIKKNLNVWENLVLNVCFNEKDDENFYFKASILNIFIY